MLFDWSMAEFVERYLKRRATSRLPIWDRALSAPTPAHSIRGRRRFGFHHSSGRQGGMAGMWGYVRGGMGMVSFYFCDAAREAGATVVFGRAGGADPAGRRRGTGGWGADSRRASLVSMPIPGQTMNLLGAEADAELADAQMERVPMRGAP